MARVDFSVRAHERRRMGPGPLRHLAHLACIAHAVLLAKTHMGRRARVATPARKKHLAIPITMTSIILTYGFAQIHACRIAQCAANNGGSWHVRRYAETINEHPFPPRFKVGASEKIAARWN